MPIRIAIWEAITLRCIILYKAGKSAVFFSIGLSLLELLHQSLSQFTLRSIIFFHLDPSSPIPKWLITQASAITDKGLMLISLCAFTYALLFATEGLGLYLRKRWADYVVLVSTGSLLPFEFYDLCSELALWKLVAYSANFLIVLYLLRRINSRTPMTIAYPCAPSPTPTASVACS